MAENKAEGEADSLLRVVDVSSDPGIGFTCVTKEMAVTEIVYDEEVSHILALDHLVNLPFCQPTLDTDVCHSVEYYSELMSLGLITF